MKNTVSRPISPPLNHPARSPRKDAVFVFLRGFSPLLNFQKPKRNNGFPTFTTCATESGTTGSAKQRVTAPVLQLNY